MSLDLYRLFHPRNPPYLFAVRTCDGVCGSKESAISTDQRTVTSSRHLAMVQIWYYTRSNGNVMGCFSARKVTRSSLSLML